MIRTPRHTMWALAFALVSTSALAFDNPPSCPGDNVVWVNTKSRIYHYRSTTAQGAFACEKAALAQGARAAKNEIAPVVSTQ